MALPIPHLLLGLLLRAVAATGLAATGAGLVMPALADEAAPGAFDTSKLLKFPDYSVPAGDGVATAPIKTMRVKKIEFGRVSYVDILTTASGTYSSDGIASPQISYPGVDEMPALPRNAVGIWSGRHRWPVLPRSGGSFLYQQAGNSAIFTQDGHTCVMTPFSFTC